MAATWPPAATTARSRSGTPKSGTQYCSARFLLTGIGCLLEFLEMSQHFLLRGPAGEEEAEHLVRPLRRLLARPQAQQQAGDDRHVHLQPHPVLALRQQVPPPQDALEPAEEQ